jgi:hypothetical protein
MRRSSAAGTSASLAASALLILQVFEVSASADAAFRGADTKLKKGRLDMVAGNGDVVVWTCS